MRERAAPRELSQDPGAIREGKTGKAEKLKNYEPPSHRGYIGPIKKREVAVARYTRGLAVACTCIPLRRRLETLMPDNRENVKRRCVTQGTRNNRGPDRDSARCVIVKSIRARDSARPPSGRRRGNVRRF